PTGATIDRAGAAATWRSIARTGRRTGGHVPLATIGESLVLRQMDLKFASFGEHHLAEWGDSEFDWILITEIDPEAGCLVRSEFFAADQLAAAIVRLYERDAELLPEGSARANAEHVARTMATLLAPRAAADEWAALFAPEVSHTDHRTL